jgi:Flp pilus assembly protein TadD
MSKDRILFSIVGALAGFVVGFMFANSVNRAGPADAHAGHDHGPQQQMEGLPPDHPPIDMAAMKADPAALAEAAERADQSPDDFDAQAAAASAYYRARKFDEAVKYLTRANKIKPDDYDVIVGLGNASFDGEKFAEAERWYAAALKIRPDDVNVRTDMGLTFMFREPADNARAVAEFKRSLERDPAHPQTLQNLTVAYTRQGDAANARAALAKLEAANPKGAALAKLREEIERLGAAPAQAQAQTGGKGGD